MSKNEETMRMKFLLIKNDDMLNYLSQEQHDALSNICKTMEQGRLADGKKTDYQYLVINTDEPYVSEVIEILKKNGHWG